MDGEPDLYIAGTWRHASDGGTRDIINPADGSVAAVVDEATPGDAREAVAAARAAFDDGAWRATPIAERAALLDRIADLLQRDKEELATLETRDTGKTLAESRIDIDDVTSVFRYYAKLVGADGGPPRRRRRRPGGDQPGGPRTHRGVRADRPVELSAAADVLEDRAGARRGLHDGRQTQRGHAAVHDRVRAPARGGWSAVPAVVNLVQGSGAVLGEALTARADVDFISFTGGLATGPDHLEDGGRQRHQGGSRTRRQEPAHRVRRRPRTGDGDGWDAAVDHVLTGVFLHSGQVCSAGTRLIVEESIADEFVAAVAARAEKITMGDGMDPASETGPLVSEQHRAKVEAYVELGISEGAKLITGGARPTDPALAKRQLLSADDLRPVRPVDAHRPGGDLRSDPHGRAIHHRSRGDRPRQRHGVRSRGRCADIGHRRGANVWCGHCGTARCGSTISATTPPPRSGAASASRATVASWVPPAWRNTKRSNTSGTTPLPPPRAGSRTKQVGKDCTW